MSGKTFLVLELVPGDTLADRIAKSRGLAPAIPYAEALPLARQIVDALDAAHASSVIHRDLKPSNIKITEDGRVKVLDSASRRRWTAPTATIRPTR